MKKIAHCHVCGRAAQHEKDFLCGDCVNVDSIIITCACGTRYELKPNDTALGELSKELRLPLEQGTAIKTTNCQGCSGAKNAQMTVYRINRADA